MSTIGTRRTVDFAYLTMSILKAVHLGAMFALFGVVVYVTWAWWTFRITAREADVALPALAVVYMVLLIALKLIAERKEGE